MEVLAMGLHARERRKLRQIEVALRNDDPGLDALLAGRPTGARPPPRPAVPRAPATWVLVGYLVAPAPLIAGLILHATSLVVAGAILCPLIPMITWLLIRYFIHGESSHCRKS